MSLVERSYWLHGGGLQVGSGWALGDASGGRDAENGATCQPLIGVARPH